MRTPSAFAKALSELRMQSVFNPYADTCPIHDAPNAAKVRQLNLVRFLEAAIATRVDTLWIARDLGYRGGRRTGVPLTDEIHLERAGALLGGVEFKRATRGPAMAERTAAVIWNVLSRIDQPVFLWNIFPLHPHEKDDPLSNRCHTRAEREATWALLEALICMIQPKRIVAIGRDAGLALTNVELPVHVVRHPSYGGQTEFIAGINSLYGVRNAARRGSDPELPLLSFRRRAVA